jgi:CBS domain-containing protein
VPVVRDGKVVGIISRANLVRALATAPELHRKSNETDDRHIRERLLAELKRQDWARVWPEDIQVTDGVVHFWLPDDMPSAEIDALRIAAENIPGVREVKMHMLFIPVIPGF